MELELHQLGLRYSSLRVANALRRAQLVASLAAHGQQSPVLVVVSEGAERYVLIDGYARVEGLRELGRDLVAAAVLDVPETDALIVAHRLEAKRRRSALEEGWLLAELVDNHEMNQRTLAKRMQRSVSWVCRRLSLVKILPLSVQVAVQRGLVPPHAAMKHLVPLARANKTQCEELVHALGDRAVADREVERLYHGWKRADGPARERIVQQPRLFLQAEEASRSKPAVPGGDPASPLIRDLDGITALARRVRRRVDEGLLDELDQRRRKLVMRSRRKASDVFESLNKLMTNRT